MNELLSFYFDLWLKIAMFYFLNIFFLILYITLRNIAKRRLYKWYICYVLWIYACRELNLVQTWEVHDWDFTVNGSKKK